MTVSLAVASLNLSVALGCGALIGMERQIRQRKAGLRTNALVALGAAAYMVFSMLIEGDMSPSRVAAQVVSGIGFLGAGIIFRDGFNVQGLTTAATLWCSAAVGLLAGHGNWDFALVTTGLVVFVNFALRPFVQWLKRRVNQRAPDLRAYRVVIEVPAAQEAATRSLMLRVLTLGGLHLGGIDMRPATDGVVSLSATVTAEGLPEMVLEQAVQHLASEPGLLRVHWLALEDG
ncbi:MgtC/SapB family protein [Rhodobacter sp. SGA-6-6]|uniref:MgtC/SapB family protein n=1 Tax=Rhodobacter sp. SGA-6-6 TaxID=2710882 RepID=UPI0013EA4C61|nr:MgtC/SapB family protein [Rhodobacter sp. SGA-6-6]NGM46899.1 MgtC/SapB family protein [Rhodobacter sp. SGA-6-6]